ncbi:OmpH family outer membrane protein [Asticcacaulis solisilvae]|uniref:OmpH family outer membrane protein n=1 Tax=Asticcacaulis solisilvae TaxID=1217274 RepID=UPI003FD87402
MLLLVGVAALVAGAAHAQTAATPPAPPTFGAPIQGQCVIDVQQAMVDSTMGKAAQDRLGQLKAVVDSELQQQAQALETEMKSLQAQQKTVTPATKAALESKAQAWGQKRDAFQAKVQQRQQEMQYTQQEAMAVLFQKMVPHINSVVTAKGCATVVQADSLLHYDAPGANNGPSSTFVYANPAMNITAAVVQKMDASGETLPQIDRVSLDQQQGQAGAAAPAAPRAAAPAAGTAPKK